MQTKAKLFTAGDLPTYLTADLPSKIQGAEDVLQGHHVSPIDGVRSYLLHNCL